MGAGAFRLASHLTWPQLRRRPDQEDLLPSAWSNMLSCFSSQTHHSERCRQNLLITPSPLPSNTRRSMVILQNNCSTLLVTSITSLLLQRLWLSTGTWLLEFRRSCPRNSGHHVLIPRTSRHHGRGSSPTIVVLSRGPLPADYLGLSQRLWAVHNVAMSLGAVEIFFILVVVALVAYVLWRLVIRPRR